MKMTDLSDVLLRRQVTEDLAEESMDSVLPRARLDGGAR